MMDREGHNECSLRFLYDNQMDLALRGRLLLGVLYIGLAGVIFMTAVFAVSPQKIVSAEVVLGGEKIKVNIADTPALHARGLSGVKKLNPGEGMLFIFPSPGFYGFWMKAMSIQIDIIWFDANREIVDVWENATPSSYPEIRIPVKEAMYVLEVEAGFSAKHTLKKGDVLELKPSTRYNE